MAAGRSSAGYDAFGVFGTALPEKTGVCQSSSRKVLPISPHVSYSEMRHVACVLTCDLFEHAVHLLEIVVVQVPDTGALFILVEGDWKDNFELVSTRDYSRSCLLGRAISG
jgi:hypothetical protein